MATKQIFPVRCTAKLAFYGKPPRRYRQGEEFDATFEITEDGAPFVLRGKDGEPIVRRDKAGNWLLPYSWMELREEDMADEAPAAKAPKRRKVAAKPEEPSEPNTMTEMAKGAAARAAPVG